MSVAIDPLEASSDPKKPVSTRNICDNNGKYGTTHAAATLTFTPAFRTPMTRQQPLGGQQLQSLRRLREASDSAVHEEHLKRSGGVSASLYDVQQPVDPLASRTVDAIVQERLQKKGNSSTSARLRDKVTAARRGVQTERSERSGDELRQQERAKTTRKIGAVRRRGGAKEEKGNDRRRIGKLEAEWIEKQLQYKTRVATLEKESRTAWQSFFAGAGALTSSTGFLSPAGVNKLLEEMVVLREEDVHKIKHQLRRLSSKVNDVQAKVEEIANGDQFFSELQEKIDTMEAALSKFRLDQRKHFEGYVLEEKVLEKELASFMEKMERWESEVPPQLIRGGASSASLVPRLVHLSRNSSLNVHILTSRGQSKSNNDDVSVNCSNGNQEEEQTVKEGTPDEIGMINRVRRLNEAILRSGGLKGGWDSREHATFTTLLHSLPDDWVTHLLRHNASNQDSNHEDKALTNSRSDYETRVARFLCKCMRKIVTQTESSVRSHFEWYLRHLELVEEKKRVIQKWKMRKEEERQQIIQCGFDADGTALDNLDRDGTPETSRSTSSQEQSDRAKLKSREKTERLLEQWKREKKQKEEDKEQRRRELQKKRDALEAKVTNCMGMIASVLSYLLKPVFLTLLAEARAIGCQAKNYIVQTTERARGDDVGSHSKAPTGRCYRRCVAWTCAVFISKTKTTDENANTLPKPVMVLNATEASKARGLSKEEIRWKERRRERQSAHDAYIPGKKAIPDVKFKSFGHIPIQPRAVPAWRKNI
ncbi:hypothetical protein GQ600_18256 [Phytophthora cactorum]|nr:hypothetical protein GQ600_18256 [Phytophthora cactorum]